MPNIRIISNSITNHLNSFDSYKEQLLDFIKLTSNDVSLIVFPEYCWGNSNIKKINQLILEFREFDHPNLLLGSHRIELNGIIFNSAIYVNRENEVTYIPKTNILKGEIQRHSVVSGINPGVIKCDEYNIGILICADLWDASLVNNLVIKGKADLLVVPAFTIVPKGYEYYAKYQWYSLCISRSREFVIPIIVSDHSVHGADYDVGGVSTIVDPSIKSKKIHNLEDFLHLSKNTIIERTLDLNKIADYRNYRIDAGLYTLIRRNHLKNSDP